MGDHNEKCRVQHLYPVQGKQSTFFGVPLDKEEDKPEETEDASINGNLAKTSKRFSKSNSRVSFSPSQDLRRHSVEPRRTSDISKASRNRKVSLLPLSSIRGPNGRRQSAKVEYDFYNKWIASVPELAAHRCNLKGETKVQVALHECATAVKHIKLQGIRQFVQAATIITKAFWFLLFIACISILIYEVIISFNNYYTSPVTTTFTIKTPQSIKFPDIYICFGNSLNRSYIRQHPEAVKGIQNLYATVVGGDKRRRKREAYANFEDFSMPWDRTVEHVTESWLHAGFEGPVEERQRRSAPSKNHSDLDAWNTDGEVSYDFLLDAGFKVNETFLNCSFQSYKTYAYECNQIVKTVMDPNYFTCYVVTIPKGEKQVLADKGLRLLINSQVSQYPQIAANDTVPNKYAGLFVSISDRFDPTNWHKGVVRPGSLTKLSLSATNIKLLDMERGSVVQRCVDEGSFQYRVFNTSYSRTACQMDCLVYAFYQHCNCVFKMDKNLVKRDILKSAPFCAYSHTQACLIPNVTSSSAVLERVNQCRKRCYTPCQSMRYHIRGSSSVLNPAAFSKKLLVKDLVQLDIAFGRLEFSELTQSYSKTVAQMIADIGGQVNLWIGASVITLLEAPILLSLYCCYRLCRKAKDTFSRGSG